MIFKEALGKQLIVADGGLGTYLQDFGLAPGEAPALWSITHPDEIRSIHGAYIEAGADLITTNTFTANTPSLQRAPYSVEEVVTAAVTLAQEAKEEHGSTCYIALDIGPLGQFLEPLGLLSFDDAVGYFKEQVAAGVAKGVDLILIETMIDLHEVEAAVAAAKEVCDLPVVASVTIDASGHMLDGSDVERINDVLEGLGVAALGFNCSTGPAEMSPYIKELAAHTSTPLVVMPNAGLPELVEGKLTYASSPAEFAALLCPLAKEYLALVGGCCGTTPDYIKALVAACKAA